MHSHINENDKTEINLFCVEFGTLTLDEEEFGAFSWAWTEEEPTCNHSVTRKRYKTEAPHCIAKLTLKQNKFVTVALKCHSITVDTVL